MIYLSFILLAFSAFILYKEKGDTRIFLFLLTVGWIVSVFLFIAYIQFLDYRELFQNLFSKKSLITSLLPKTPVTLSDSAATIITLMNLGIAVFIYSALCLPLSFLKPLRQNTVLYALIAVPQLLQFLIYSPWAYEKVYRWLFVTHNPPMIAFPDFYAIDDSVHHVTSLVNHAYIILGVAIMIYNYVISPKIKYLRSYYFLITSGYTSIVFLYITFLWWAPKRLISLTTAENSMHFLPVSILVESNIIGFYPHIMLLSFLSLLFALYRFNHIYFSQQSIRKNIYRSFDITNAGIRFYNHMVKNFTMAILVDAESLKSKTSHTPSDLVYLDRIIRNAKELQSTLTGIQSKFAVTSLNLSVADITEVMDRALDQFKQEETLTLEYEAPKEPIRVLLDAQHMREVFINLLNNSLQAMQSEPRRLNISICQDKKWVDVSIADNGCGIDKNDLGKVFIPFFSTRDSKGNWGLGLSYCYRVIMGHQGKIFIDSEIGNGTLVKVLLPLHKE